MIDFEDLTAFTPENLKRRRILAHVAHLRIEDGRASCLLLNGEHFWADTFSNEQAIDLLFTHVMECSSWPSA